MIEQEVERGSALSVRQRCELLQVNRAWYYQQRQRPASQKDAPLRAAIEAIVLEHGGYGYRRVTHQLQRQGWRVNPKRVLRVMHEAHLLATQPRKRVRTSTPAPASAKVQDNLLLAFTASGPNQVWVADITSISLPKHVAYLAAIVDAYSRVCVGWHLSVRIDSQ